VKVLFRRQVYSNSSTGLEKSAQGVHNTPPSPIFVALLACEKKWQFFCWKKRKREERRKRREEWEERRKERKKRRKEKKGKKEREKEQEKKEGNERRKDQRGLWKIKI
jgi:hypothetical protein